MYKSSPRVTLISFYITVDIFTMAMAHQTGKAKKKKKKYRELQGKTTTIRSNNFTYQEPGVIKRSIVRTIQKIGRAYLCNLYYYKTS